MNTIYNLPGYDNLLRDLNGGGEPGVGTPGFAGPGAVTGIGNQTVSQAVSAAMSGARNGGAVGQGLGLTGLMGTAAGKAATMGLQAVTGAPGLPVSLANTFIGMLMGLAKGALRSSNQKVGPVRFGAPPVVPDIHFDATGPGFPDTPPDGLSSSFTTGLGLSPTPTSYTTDLDLGLAQTGLPGTIGLPGIPDGVSLGIPGTPVGMTGLPSEADVGQGISDGGNGPAGGPGGNSGAPSDGGDSGNPGDFYHGGPVHGPSGRDRVPAHLTAGEYVIDADSARHFLGVLDQINRWHR